MQVLDGFLGPDDFSCGKALTESESGDDDSEDRPWSVRVAGMLTRDLFHMQKPIPACLTSTGRQARDIECTNSLDHHSFVWSGRHIHGTSSAAPRFPASRTGSPLAFRPLFITPNVLINKC